MRLRLSTWLWIWAAWTLVGVFFGTSLWLNYVAAGRESSFRGALTVSMLEWWAWALLTPIPVWLARRWPPGPPLSARAVGLHMMAGLGVAFVKAVLERQLRISILGVTPLLLPNNIARHFVMYWAIVGIVRAVDYYVESRRRELEASRMEAQLHRARLDALEGQLRPHFLFNALNTIAETVHEDADKADRMIANLGDLLRASLDREGPTIPLADELANAERYLAIEQARYGDRLRVSIEVPDALHVRPVPRLVLQPLLENAIHHGVGSRPAGGWVGISARPTPSGLTLTVDDDGDGLEQRGTSGNGIGLSNTRERLAVLYGDRATVNLTARPEGGTRVTLTLPDGI